MSTEIEITDQDDSETDEAAIATFEEADAPIDLDSASENVADGNDLAELVELDSSDEVDLGMGEWSLCASMIFLAAYLVVLMFGVLGHPVWDTIWSFKLEAYRTEFPVGVATILLLISVLSAFCAFISLVADKNNRRTMLIRLVTLWFVLPTLTAGLMIYIIIQRGAGNSILERILG